MTRNGTLSVVFDCMVFLQAAISETGPAAEILRQVERRKFSLFVSQEIIEEIRAVFSKPKILKHNPQVTVGFIESFLTRISETATVRDFVPKQFSLSRDPKDEKYINLAVNENVDFLVSRDRDLLDLMTDYSDEAKEFRQRFRGLTVISPAAFLERLK